MTVDFILAQKALFWSTNDSKYVFTTLHSNTIETITQKNKLPIPENPPKHGLTHVSTTFGCPVIDM